MADLPKGFVDKQFKSLRRRWDDDELRIEMWFERDRAHVGIQEQTTGAYLVSWWDEDVYSLVEGGFFVSGKGARALERSVIEYAEHMGVRAYSKPPPSISKARALIAAVTESLAVPHAGSSKKPHCTDVERPR